MPNVMTPEFRVSYPAVFKAKKNDLNGKDEYSIVMLFPKGADLSKLIQAAEACIAEKFGADKNKWPKQMRNPFRDQGEREKLDEATGKMVLPAGYEKGAIFITSKSEQRPGLVDAQVQDIVDTSQFYAGCFARATLRPYFYDNKGNRGVSFGLGNIQKTRDGDPLTGRTRAQDDFAPIEGATESAGGASAASLFS